MKKLMKKIICSVLFGSMLVSALPVRAHEPVAKVSTQTTFFAGLWSSVQSFFNSSSTTTKVGIGAGIAALAGLGYWYWKTGVQRPEAPKKDKDADYKELCAAIQHGNTNAIVRLINESEDLYMNGAYADGKTILMLVIEQWQKNAQDTMSDFNIATFDGILQAIVKKLKANPTSPAKYMCLFTSKDNNDDTIFHYAARTKSDELIKRLILAIPKYDAVQNIDMYLKDAKNKNNESALDLCGAETINSLRTFLPQHGYSLTLPAQARDRDEVKRPEIRDEKDDREEESDDYNGLDGVAIRSLFEDDEHDHALSDSMMLREPASPSDISHISLPNTARQQNLIVTPLSASPASAEPMLSPSSAISSSPSASPQPQPSPIMDDNDEEEADEADQATPNLRVSRLLGHVSNPAAHSSSSSTAAEQQAALERKSDKDEVVDRTDKGSVDQTQDPYKERAFVDVIEEYKKIRNGSMASGITDIVGLSDQETRTLEALAWLRMKMAQLGIKADSRTSDTNKEFFVYAVATEDFALVQELLMRGEYKLNGLVQVTRSEDSKGRITRHEAYDNYASKWNLEPKNSDKYKINALFIANWKR